ncbi:MAG TPA: hypothetical protein VGB15_22530 [Longimicrobium sp.]|jgi:hypothetical protein
MRKIKLELEMLDVLSFVTDATAEERGSVEAHVGSRYCDTINRTCDGAETCGGETCGVAYSCAASCGACDTYECTGEGSTIGTYETNQSGIGCGM